MHEEKSIAAVAEHDAGEHIVPSSLFLKVWGVLVVLTAFTVGASIYFPGVIGVSVALIVTPVKAALILLYFMHLKYENTAFRAMFLVTIGILAVFMGLTFFDYLYR